MEFDSTATPRQIRRGVGASGENSLKNLDERFGGFDGVGHGVAGLVDDGLDLVAGALGQLLSFIGEALCLLAEVVASFFEVVAGVCDTFAELLASLYAGLWERKEERR